MRYIKAETLDDAVSLKSKYTQYIFFSGGSDLSLHLKNSETLGLIDISHLKSLKGIQEREGRLTIGALTTINDLLESEVVKKRVPLLYSVCETFASHQVRNIATLAGNIVNDSPVADMIAPLLVLRSDVTLYSEQGERTLVLEEIFKAYKSLSIESEILHSFTMEFQSGDYYYRKVGLRNQLNITKVSLVLLKDKTDFILSGASLNPYVQRFFNLEKLLSSGVYDEKSIVHAIEKDTNPHSQKEYKRQVLFNMLQEALESLEK